MNNQQGTKKIKDIINRFLNKLTDLEKKKMDIIKKENEKEDIDAIAQAQEKIKNL